jgi:hypothetical protein
MSELSWSFAQIWNESLEQSERRPLKPRKHLWASELGKAPIDTWLKMKATAPSNPFDPRSLRKFEAGHIWEWIVGLVLKRAGLFISEQDHLAHQYPGLLEVTGKLDFLAGGNPDWERARSDIQSFGLPAFVVRTTDMIIEHFKNSYPNGIKELVLEIKSCSAFMFEHYMRNNEASSNHRLQTFHYIKASDRPEGHIVYISKDDARMLEIGVMNPSYVEEEYKKHIAELTHYVEADEQPPLEDIIVFEGDKFSVNWRVKYSNYLTMLYGFKNQNAVDETFKGQVAQWNRVLGRCVGEKKMTKANEEIIKDIKLVFPSFDDMVEEQKKAKGAENNE